MKVEERGDRIMMKVEEILDEIWMKVKNNDSSEFMWIRNSLLASKKNDSLVTLLCVHITIWNELNHLDEAVPEYLGWVKGVSDSCIPAQILNSIRPNAIHFISPIPQYIAAPQHLIHSGDYEFCQTWLRHSA